MEDKPKDVRPKVQVIIEQPNASGAQAQTYFYHEGFQLTNQDPEQGDKVSHMKMILQEKSLSDRSSGNYVLARGEAKCGSKLVRSLYALWCFLLPDTSHHLLPNSLTFIMVLQRFSSRSTSCQRK